jgi:predicted Zn-dependent protease
MLNSQNAQSELTELLKLYPESPEVSETMGDVLYQTTQFQSAILHYKQIVDKDPYNFEVFARLVDVCNRNNKLDLLEPTIEKMNSKHYITSGGSHYIKGMFLLYHFNNLDTTVILMKP